MKVVAVLFALLNSTITFAAPTQYRINSQLFINGKLVSSPRLIAMQDQASEITSTNSNEMMQLKVVASDLADKKVADGILMKFEVEYISGDRTFKISPQISVTPGSEATVTVGKTSTQDEVALKVTATRE